MGVKNSTNGVNHIIVNHTIPHLGQYTMSGFVMLQ